jgi:ribonucleoside-diphosphate reductase alpha chain
MPLGADALAQAAAQLVTQPVRRKLPDERKAITHKFDIAGHEVHHGGVYDDGQPGEIFLVMAKEGSTIWALPTPSAQAIDLTRCSAGVPLQALVASSAMSGSSPRA